MKKREREEIDKGKEDIDEEEILQKNQEIEEKRVRFQESEDSEEENFKKPPNRIKRKDNKKKDEDEIKNYDDEDEAQFERDSVTGFIMHVDGEEEFERDVDELQNEMGFKLEPFNLKEEMNEGDFNEEGFFIENKRNFVKDAWLDSMETSKYYIPKHLREKAKKKEEEEEEIDEKDEKNILQLKEEIVKFLEEGESVRKALLRLAKQKNPTKTNKSKIFISRNEDNKDLPKEKKTNSNEFDVLTECANDLLAMGYHDAYTITKKKLEMEIREEKESEHEWEYRDIEGRIQGPFSGEQMKSWMDQNYFQDTTMVRNCLRKKWEKISNVKFSN